MFGSDEGIKIEILNDKFLITLHVNVDVITLGFDVGTDLGSIDRSFDGFL